jgi:hypothetical protein
MTLIGRAIFWAISSTKTSGHPRVNLMITTSKRHFLPKIGVSLETICCDLIFAQPGSFFPKTPFCQLFWRK